MPNLNKHKAIISTNKNTVFHSKTTKNGVYTEGPPSIKKLKNAQQNASNYFK
jgi:hypothetical protein